jgi:sodium-dependent dicarboxylate transporter 2/3/5
MDILPDTEIRAWRIHTLWAGPAAGALLSILLAIQGLDYAACIVAGITLWCASWWIFEPVPIPATSLIPLAAFPLLGVMSGADVALAFGDPIILLMMGGAMLSKAMEKSGTHRRLALGLLRVCGNSSGRRVVIGFMAASALLSMWISNTATALMLLPVAMAVSDPQARPRLTVPLLLAIAYGSSIGGLGTPIGTPPNLIFLSVYRETTGITISFLQWMLWALPVVALLFPLAAWWLTRGLAGEAGVTLPETGTWRSEEKRVLTIFAAVAIAWITMDEPFGGWRAALGLLHANYAAVALIAVVVLFMMPDGRGGRLLDWDSAKSIEWGVLLLFAGGITIAQAFVSSGLSAALGDALTAVTVLPAMLVVLSLCLAVTFLTEVTSNTATATLLMPVLAAAALVSGWEPALLMVPAALSASCAFMLPVATPPNAIVFASGQLSVAQMARVGLALNVLGALVITFVAYTLF